MTCLGFAAMFKCAKVLTRRKRKKVKNNGVHLFLLVNNCQA